MEILNRQDLLDHFRYSGRFYFIVTDTSGQLLYSNELFNKRSGGSASQYRIRSLTEMIAKEDIPRYYTAIGKSMQSPGRNVEVDLFFLQPNNIYSRISWELVLLQNGKSDTDLLQWIGIEAKNFESDYVGESNLFYRNLIADSLDGILLTDNKGFISFASASVKKVLGFEAEDLLHKNAFDFIHPDDREDSRTAFQNEVVQTPHAKFINARLLQKSGEWLWCMVRGHNLFSNPHIGAMLIYFADDSLRKNAEIALKESEQRFRQLIHGLSVGVLLLNERSNVLVANQSASKLIGLAEEEIVREGLFNLPWDIIGEDGAMFPEEDYPIKVAIKTKKVVRDIVMGVRMRGKPDRQWLLVNAEPLSHNGSEPGLVICSFTDITEQKKLSAQLMEQEIQKQKLLIQATIDGQEKERVELSRELHDNISQHITTTRLYLEVAREKAEGELLTLINHAHKGLMEIVFEIRRLSQSLVPPSLNDIGLLASIEDLCAFIKNTQTFTIGFKHKGIDESLLPDNVKLALFRITQELLNNIIRHAHASLIDINLKMDAENIQLSVSDNGNGFELRSVKRGLGFDNMISRAGLLGGRLDIEAAPGKGCRVLVIIPFR